MKITIGKKSLLKFGKWSLLLLSIVLVTYFAVQFTNFAVATINEVQANGMNRYTYVNTSVEPDKWTDNDTGEWYNFTITLSNGNVSEVNIIVPNITATTANFTVDNASKAPNTNLTGWTVNYPSNYTGDGLPRIINFSIAPASAFTGSARFDIYATANISSASDSLTNVWNISVMYNETLTRNLTYLNVSADTKIPVIKDPTPSNASYINGSSDELFQINITDNNVNASNVTFQWKICTVWPGTCGGPQPAVTLTCYNTSLENITFICNTTLDLTGQPETINISYYFETADNVTNYASNGTASATLVTTIDRIDPNPSNIVVKYDVGTKYDTSLTYGFQVDWSDANNVSFVYFESNFTSGGSTFANATATRMAGTNTWKANFTQAKFLKAANYTYKWYANDTTGVNWNVSNTTVYWIRQADNPTTILLDGTDTSSLSVTYGTTVNVTGYATARSGAGTLYRNSSGSWSNVSDSATPDENNTALTLDAGAHGFTMNASGNANYSANNSVPLYVVSIAQGAANVTLKLNSSLANQTIQRGQGVNVSLKSNVTQGWVFLYNTTSDGTDIMNQSTATPITSGSLNITNYTTWTAAAGSEWNITAYYNGSENYSASGLATWWIKIDSTQPTSSDLSTNVSNTSTWGKYEGIVDIGALWADDLNVSWSWNATNATGNWVNGTAVHAFVGSNNMTNFSIDMSTISVTTGDVVVIGRIFVNDTSGNENTTGIMQWTIDGTTPTFNTTTPVDDSYINGSSDELFQVYGYDQSFNYSNSSITYRYCSGAGCGGWQSAVSLTCYNMTTSNVSFICNTTSIDLSLRSEGEVVHFYFDGSDYSWLYGNNGTALAPLNATIDRGAPTYANNNTNITNAGTVAALDDAVLIYANWTDGTALGHAILQTNESGVWRNYTDGTHDSPYDINATDGETWSNFTWQNTSLPPGAVVMWRIFANDTVDSVNNHQNVTVNLTYFTIDNTQPWPRIFDTNTTNASTVFKGAGINVSAEWSDNTKLDKWLVYYNDTNVAGINRTASAFASTNNSNSSYIINTSNFSVGIVFKVNFYVNDTTGNENVSETWFFTVDGTKPTEAPGFVIGSNFTNDTTIGKEAMINVSANWTDNIALDHYWMWYNYTGTVAGANDTARAFATTNRSNATSIVNASGVSAGDTFLIRFYANDTSNNENASALLRFTIDSTQPWSSLDDSNTTNTSAVFKGAGINITANWSDNTLLDKWWVWYNDTSVAGINRSYTKFTVSNNSNVSFIINTSNFTSSSVVIARFYANDTTGNENVSDTWQFTIDGTAPKYGNLTVSPAVNTMYAPSTTYIFNVSYSDNINTSIIFFEWNGSSNYSATLATTCDSAGSARCFNYSYTLTDLGKSNNTYRWLANDTSGNWNVSMTNQTYNITQNTSTSNYMNLTINSTADAPAQANRTVTYPEAVNVTGNTTGVDAFSGQTITFTLYRNDGSSETTVGTGDQSQEIVLGNGTYNYTYKTIGNTNYSSASKTYYVLVNKGDTSCSISPTTQTITYEATITPYCYSNATEVECSLWRDDVNKTSTENDTAMTYGVAAYTLKSNNTETGNYTACTAATSTITINKKAFTIGMSPSSGTITYGTLTTEYVISNDTATASKVSLWRQLVNKTTLNDTSETLSYGIWTFSANSSHSTSNYSWSEQTATVQVSKADPSNNMTLRLNGSEVSSQVRTYPNQTNISAVKNSTGDGNCVWALLRNGTDILSAENNTLFQLNASGWNYTYSVTTCTNYTNGQVDLFMNMLKRPTNMSLWLNGVQGHKEIELGVDANFTAVITNETYTMRLNITTNISASDGWVNQTRLSVGNNISNITETSGFTVARYNITGHFDGDENHTADSVTYYLNITDDVTAPTVKLWDDGLGDYGFNNTTARRVGATISLNISVSDTGVGTSGETCFAEIGGSSAGSVAYSSNWCNLTATVPSGLNDGPRLLNITINDTNNNTGMNNTYYITVDSTAPVLTITFPAANGTYNKSDSNGYIWINGTVYDALQMGVGNVSINGTQFNDSTTTANPFSFTGGNDTAFAYNNTSAIVDGLIAFTINYTDNATNIGNVTTWFYVDNTAPSDVYGITNSSSQNYAQSSSQTIEVLVIDAQQTNRTITLNYYINGSWQTALLTGTPSTSTTYSGTISTVGSDYKTDWKGRAYVPYYVTGVDNATNPMSGNNGTRESPLANLTLGDTGAIDGYVTTNDTTPLIIEGATVSVNKTGVSATTSSSDGYYYISGLTSGAYIVMVNKTGYFSNQSDATTITIGTTTEVNVTVASNVTGAISGYITTNDTTPVYISGATVSINATGISATYSGADGYYYISDVPPGDYAVSVNATDYLSNSTTTTVLIGTTSEANVSIASNATGVLSGYVYLTNTTSTIPNSSVRVSDGTRTVSTDANGYYYISGALVGTYTLTVSGNGYRTNSTAGVSLSPGGTATTNLVVTGAESFNVTIPGSSTASGTIGTNGFLDSGWHTFWMRTGILSGGTTNYTVESLFSSIGQGSSWNYSSVWLLNTTTGALTSYHPKQASTLVNITSSSGLYYIKANTTDRVEIEARYT